MTGRAVFTTAYAVIPRVVMRDIVTSMLPFWRGTRAWILARPMTGFAETFSQYVVEVEEGGGSERPDTEPEVESVLYVLSGAMTLDVGGAKIRCSSGAYAYVPPSTPWAVVGDEKRSMFVWIRKRYQAVDGLEAPPWFVVPDERDVVPESMPDTEGAWSTTRFVDPLDLRHDMHVNIVTFKPGAVIPFKETHVMEHGIFVLQGKAVYHLNHDWVEVEEGDFIWLRAFCPQACYAGGPSDFRYLLYKDVNRHPPFLSVQR
ncbi:hypothetical protein CTAYLR_002510 [Chrysophaeum taylorii]|uniref:Cupin type-2 domain-containing protein n=1 Tax=Chrysophaeum taylorii TaxID=2483200 RepID=A0AAD7UF55_9STRA|nr:hypothetical protein CTAYLR_002510 [Chrysophaeum taylorii]